jgi:hypothetical protein
MAEKSGGKGLKSLISIILMADLALLLFLGYLWFIERESVKSDLAKAQNDVKRIKRDVLEYKDALGQVIKEGIKDTTQPATYIKLQLEQAGIDLASLEPMDTTPQLAPVREAQNYAEQTWRVRAKTGKDRSLYPMAVILRACELIERGNPKFKVKEVNLGEREPGFDKDLWAFDSIVVRKIVLK